MTLTWIIAAFFAGAVAKAVRLPTLVGYLAAGLVLATVGVTGDATLDAVGDLGVTLLLFTVGLHISLRSLVQPEVVGVGTTHLLLSTVLFTGVWLAFGLTLAPAVLLAVALGFSSTVLTAKSLDANDELDSYHGRLSIGILVLQDVVAVVLLAVSGGGAPSVWAIGLLVLPLARPLLQRAMHLVGRDELLVIYGLLVALGTGWLFEVVGLDAKLGALVAGMLLSGDERAEELYEKLWALKEVFLVGFFLQVGLGGFPDGAGWLTIGALLLFLPLKGVAFFGLMTTFRLRARTAFLSSVSLTAYSEFALIVAAGAVGGGLLDASYLVIVGLLVAISYAINAPFGRAVNVLWQRLETRLIRFERATDHPDHEPRSLGAADYVVLGMGQAGTAAYDYLVEQGKRPVGLDADPAQLQRHLQAGRRVVYGDANDPELWTGLKLTNIHGVLMTLSNETAEVNAARNLRAEGYDGFIAALLRYPENREALQAAGVSTSFLPIAQAGRELAQACFAAEEEVA